MAPHGAVPLRARRRTGGIVRKMRPGERDLLAGHLLRLSPWDRRMRFCGHVSADWIGEYCRRDTPLRALRIGYFADGVLRGAGELVTDPGSLFARRAEVALSVESPWQGRGVGRRLMSRLLLLSRNRNVQTLYMYCLEENTRMRGLARSFGSELELEDGQVHGRLLAPWPTQLSLAEEAMRDGYALMTMAMDAAGSQRMAC